MSKATSQYVRRHYALVIGAGICFGTTGTTQALGPDGISSLSIGSARLIVGAFFLYLYVKLTKIQSAPVPRVSLWLSALGILSYQLTFFSAVKQTGVAIGTVTALGSVPALTGLLDYLIYKQKASKRWYIATVITTIGIIILGTANGVEDFDLGGFILAIIAGASFGLLAVTSKRAFMPGVDSTYTMYKVFSLAALLSIPVLLVTGFHWLGTIDGAAMIIWLGLIPTALAYILYAKGLLGVKPGVASTLILAEPATATILAAVVLNESITLQGWAGIATVAIGLAYLSREV
jgi:drug/metabolite transporter, DME family